MERRLEGFRLKRRGKVTTRSAESREGMHDFASAVTGGHIDRDPKAHVESAESLGGLLKPLEKEMQRRQSKQGDYI